MRIAPDAFRCPRCGETKPLTPEHFCVDARGQVSGYCRPCQRAYCHAYWLAGHYPKRPPHYQRDYERRRFAIPRDRWRQRDEEATA